MTSEDNEYFFKHIKDAIRTLRLGCVCVCVRVCVCVCVVSLKAEFLNLKDFVMREINTILQKLSTSKHPNNEHTLCQKQIRYLREENSSKNLIIKILSENKSAFNRYLPQLSKSYEAYYDSNVLFIDTKKTAKCHEKKSTPHNFLSPNCVSTLDFNNDVMIMEIKSHDKDPANSYTNENTVINGKI